MWRAWKYFHSVEMRGHKAMDVIMLTFCDARTTILGPMSLVMDFTLDKYLFILTYASRFSIGSFAYNINCFIPLMCMVGGII